jgi:hypothetical protein
MSLCCNNIWAGIRQLVNGDSSVHVSKGNVTLTATRSGDGGAKIRKMTAQGLDKYVKYKCCFIRTDTRDFTKCWVRILRLLDVCIFSKFFNTMYALNPLGSSEYNPRLSYTLHSLCHSSTEVILVNNYVEQILGL